MLDLNFIQQVQEELERRLWVGPHHPTSVLDLSNALVAEWEKIPPARRRNLVESLKAGDQRQLLHHIKSQRFDLSVRYLLTYMQ